MRDVIVKDFLADGYTFNVVLKQRSHFPESVEFFD